MQCHLHQSIAEDATSHEEDASTLAAFHVREFVRENQLSSNISEGGRQNSSLNRDIPSSLYVGTQPDALSTCSKCHEGRQADGKLPNPDVCKGCHTKGNTTQGNPAKTFHAEKNHWPMKKVPCINCHKGHFTGNRDIKFLTPAVTGMCSVCHGKTFGEDIPLSIK